MENKLLYTRKEWFLNSFLRNAEISLKVILVSVLMPYIMYIMVATLLALQCELGNHCMAYPKIISICIGTLSWVMISFAIILGIESLKKDMKYYDEKVRLST